jgi:hypothetical protein
MAQIQGRFGGAAAAELETYAGQWKQIKNVMGDAAEVVGVVLLKALEGAAFGANIVAVGFYTVLEAMNKLDSYLSSAVGFDKIADESRIAAEEFGKLKEAALESADKTYKMFNSWGEGIDKAVGKMKDGTRTVRGLGNAEAEKSLNKIFVDQFKEMVKSMTAFEKEYAKMTMTTEQAEIQSLNVRLEAYRNYDADEVRLEEMKQAEIRDIMLRANNEHLRLLEELYGETANEKYLTASIDLIDSIVEAEFDSFLKIGTGWDDALILMEKHRREYTDRVKGMIREEVKAIEEVIEVSRRSAYDTSYLYHETTQSKPFSSGLSTNQEFSMTWGSYIGFLTPKVIEELNKNQKLIEYQA